MHPMHKPQGLFWDAFLTGTSTHWFIRLNRRSRHCRKMPRITSDYYVAHMGQGLGNIDASVLNDCARAKTRFLQHELDQS